MLGCRGSAFGAAHQTEAGGLGIGRFDRFVEICIILCIDAIHTRQGLRKMLRGKNLGTDPTNLLSRDEALKLLTPLAEDWLLPSVQIGIERMAEWPPKLRLPLGKRAMAAMLNDYIVEDAKKHID